MVTEPKVGSAETDWTGTDSLAAPGCTRAAGADWWTLPAARAARHGPQIGGRSTERGRAAADNQGDQNSRSNHLQDPDMFRRLCASLKLLQDRLASQTKACGSIPHSVPQPMRPASRHFHVPMPAPTAPSSPSPFRLPRPDLAGSPRMPVPQPLPHCPSLPSLLFSPSSAFPPSPHSLTHQTASLLPTLALRIRTGIAHHLTYPLRLTRRRPFSLRVKS